MQYTDQTVLLIGEVLRQFALSNSTLGLINSSGRIVRTEAVEQRMNSKAPCGIENAARSLLMKSMPS